MSPRVDGAEDGELERLVVTAASGDRDAIEQVVRESQGLVRGVARRFARKGASLEDLEQVGYVGLLGAIDRFDPSRGVRFTTYAAATIEGELKRHLRDRAWAVRIPRGLKEAAVRIRRLRSRLSQRLGRWPTIAEVARESDLGEDEVREAMQAGLTFQLPSIDAEPRQSEGTATPSRHLGITDDRLRAANRMADVTEAIRGLPERQRRILFLRYFEGLTQREIAAEIGVSQMHVSRLMRRSLSEVREQIEGP